MKLFAALALGGAPGRHFVSAGMAAWLGRGLPWGTRIANVVGSFVMGALFAGMWAPRMVPARAP